MVNARRIADGSAQAANPRRAAVPLRLMCLPAALLSVLMRLRSRRWPHPLPHLRRCSCESVSRSLLCGSIYSTRERRRFSNRPAARRNQHLPCPVPNYRPITSLCDLLEPDVSAAFFLTTRMGSCVPVFPSSGEKAVGARPCTGVSGTGAVSWVRHGGRVNE